MRDDYSLESAIGLCPSEFLTGLGLGVVLVLLFASVVVVRLALTTARVSRTPRRLFLGGHRESGFRCVASISQLFVKRIEICFDLRTASYLYYYIIMAGIKQ